MPRVHRVERCRKSPGRCPKCSVVIQKGEPYVYWTTRTTVGKSFTGQRHIRCGKPACYPKASELTSSEFQRGWQQIREIAETAFNVDNVADLETARDEIIGEIENLKDETQGKFDNMPPGLQEGDTGQLLQERVDALDSVIGELQSVDISFDNPNEGEDGGEDDDGPSAEERGRATEITAQLIEALDTFSA